MTDDFELIAGIPSNMIVKFTIENFILQLNIEMTYSSLKFTRKL